jgi:hypothetical protein
MLMGIDHHGHVAKCHLVCMKEVPKNNAGGVVSLKMFFVLGNQIGRQPLVTPG